MNKTEDSVVIVRVINVPWISAYLDSEHNSN